jgi:ABC-2 type transport system ATP-binding protein
VTLTFRQVSHRTLAGAEGSFERGLHVVLGALEDGTGAFAELAAGLERPRQGAVSIDGAEPHRSPATRKRVGVLLADEAPASHRTLSAQVAEVLALRDDPRVVANFLAEHGLGALAAASPRRVPPATLRHVALVLALSVPSPLAVVLFEPLATGPLGSRERVRAELGTLAAAGVVVVALTASARDASDLGGTLTLLDRGRFVRRPAAALPTELTPAAALTLAVQSSDARALAARVATDPAVSGVEWREPSDMITVHGGDASALALAVMRAASALPVEVSVIEPVLPALDEVRAASVGLWRGAYDAAYRLAEAHARRAIGVAPLERSLPTRPVPEAPAPGDEPPTEGAP